ncbi:hemerythrin domain-containing protein [Ramlibacter cellulosilyticus]
MTELAMKDACELLDADHIAVKHLFVEYARQAMAAPKEQGDRPVLAQRICQELTVHAQIEEEIFYPALRGAIGADDLLDEAVAEHQQAKDLIARIQGLQAADPTMDDLVSELARVIEHHVKEEREDLFTKARASSVDLVALGERLKARQEELMGQPA